MKRLFYLILISTISFQSYAKKHISSYLTDMSINEIKINAPLTEIKKNNKQFEIHYISDMWGEQSYLTNKKTTGHWGATIFDDAILNFRNGFLTRVCFTKPGDLNDGSYVREYNLLKSLYGEPHSFQVKDLPYKRYEWTEGDIDLILMPSEHSFNLFFGKRATEKSDTKTRY